MPLRVTDDARAGWAAFARAHGVSVNNLVEALGLALKDVERPPPWLRTAIDNARQIDAERRDR